MMMYSKEKGRQIRGRRIMVMMILMGNHREHEDRLFARDEAFPALMSVRKILMRKGVWGCRVEAMIE